MRLLYFTDVHWDTRQVAKRTGNYADDIEMKLLEIRDIAKGCDVTIFGGDWFDRWQVPDDIKVRAIKLLRGWPHTILWVTGNHDLPPEQERGLGRSSLGVLAYAFEAGTVQLLTKDVVIGSTFGFMGQDWPSIQISPTNWTAALDREDCDPANYSMTRDPKALYAIKVAHGMVLPPGGGWPMPATGMTDIDTTGIDLFLCAHTHWTNPMRTFTRPDGGECTFYGPGSVARTARSQEHHPTVAVITIEPNREKSSGDVIQCDVNIEEIRLKNVRPHSEVFPEVEEDVPGGEMFSGLVAELENSGEVNTLTPEQALERLLMAGAPSEVIAGARDYLVRAEGEVKS